MLLFVGLDSIVLQVEQGHPHLEPSDVGLKGERGRFVVLGHLNYVELLLGDAHDPKLSE